MKLLTRSFCIIATLIFLEIVLRVVNDHRILKGLPSLFVFVPRPSDVIISLLRDGQIYTHLLHTVFSFSIALIGGFSSGVLAAVWSYRDARIEAVASAVSMAISMFPIIGFYPILILMFGYNSDAGRIMIGSLLAFYPSYINSLNGFRSINREIIEAAVVDGVSDTSMMISIVLPLSIHRMINALRLAVPASFIGVIVAEWLGSRFGVGFVITQALYQLRPDRVYAVFLQIIIISTMLNYLLKKVERCTNYS